MTRGREISDRLTTSWMFASGSLVLVLPLAMAAGLLLKSLPILATSSLRELVLSTAWRPAEGAFGFAPFIVGSLVVTLLAMLLSAPQSVLIALHLTQHASSRTIRAVQPAVDVLAGIPSVVYGAWAILVIVPIVHSLSHLAGVEGSGYSVAAAAIVLAAMTIPYMVNLLVEVFRTVPIELKEAAASLGATSWEVTKHVVVRRCLAGIIASFALSLSKAFGETIAVLMVVGNVAVIPSSVFDPGYTLPALIANNYGEMMSIPRYDAALMLGAFLLLVIVSLFNIAARTLIFKTEQGT